MKRNKEIRNIILGFIASICISIGYVGLKYYNTNTDNVEKEETNHSITPIRFNFDCITDIVYNPETNLSYIKYDDPDVFDYDNLAYHINVDEWYGNYIICNIDSNIAIQFHEDNIAFCNTLDYYEKMNLNNKYVIIETESNSDISWEIKSYNCLK